MDIENSIVDDLTGTDAEEAVTGLNIALDESVVDGLTESSPIVITDKDDYAPGATAWITASGFEEGATIAFSIADDPNSPGDDGDADVYQPFTITDGGAGDFDGVVNGQVVTNWLVPTDNNGTGSGTPDALNATLNLTATGSDGRVATTTFTDAGGGLDFAAAAPFTYNHQVVGTNPAGGGAFNNRTIGNTADVVESLEGGDFKTGDLVTFLIDIDVNSLGINPSDLTNGATLELDFSFLADPNGGSGVGFVDLQNVSLNYGAVENGDGGSGTNPGIGVFGTDSGVADDQGSTATLSNKRFVIPGGGGAETPSVAFVDKSELRGTVTITDLEAGEKVILRIDGLLGNDTNPANIDLKGTLQAAILGARFVNPNTGVKETLSVGNQTIPFLSVADITIPTFSISGTKYLDANGDGSTVGDVGLDGVTVYIETDGIAGLTGTEVSTTTANGGQWSFANLGPSLVGKSVFEVLPSGYTQTLGQAGYALTGTDQTGLNFANFKNFAISGTKYLDANGDGLTAGDVGLDGVTVYIETDGIAGLTGTEVSTTTANGGQWSFANLGPSLVGKSVFEVLPSGYTQTLGQAGYALTGTDQTGLNFANFKKFDISGKKYLDKTGDGISGDDVGLGGFTIFVDKNGNGLNDDNASAVTAADGSWSIAGLGIDALSQKVYEVNQTGYVQTVGVGGLTLAGTSQPQTGLNFANFKPSGPGTGTIGYWTNKNGLAAWDSLTPKNLVDDPVSADPTKVQGILIGDFNQNGVTDTDKDEKTIFYTVTEARAILNTSTAVEGQDARLILDKQLVATWLNVLAGNTYDTLFASIKQDIANGVQWMQKATPDENGDGIGDGSFTFAGSTKLPSSDPRWSTTLGVGGNGNSYGSQIKNVLDYYNNFGAGFANDRDTSTIGGDLTTLKSLQAYQQFF